ncbi:MAG: purine-nucleoside phosphorylase [Rhodothermales bacterium]|nr:purine-nucleoside phosphorylase [Rhodothermales bacterium]
MRTDIADVHDALTAVRALDDREPELGLILGSGLGSLAELAEDIVEIATVDLPGYPRSTVEGHAGSLIIGQLRGKCVAIVRGRVHCYEGHSVRMSAFPVRLLHALGVRKLIVTNAAGGAQPALSPGTLMFIKDHINFAFRSPLVGSNEDGGPRFPDMSQPYDESWIKKSEEFAARAGIETRKGVYLWTLGPSYETKAEIRAFAHLGADAVGMSTVPEVIQAVYLNMKVIGVSTITNFAAGLSPEPLSHEDVLSVGRSVSVNLKRLMIGIVEAA